HYRKAHVLARSWTIDASTGAEAPWETRQEDCNENDAGRAEIARAAGAGLRRVRGSEQGADASGPRLGRRRCRGRAGGIVCAEVTSRLGRWRAAGEEGILV